MLLYAATLLRAQDAAARESRGNLVNYQPFIVACYIRNDVASVYILYLEGQHDDHVSVSNIFCEVYPESDEDFAGYEAGC